MTDIDPGDYRASLERELTELRRQFATGLAEDQEPGAPDRLEAIRRRIAEVKAKLAEMATD